MLFVRSGAASSHRASHARASKGTTRHLGRPRLHLIQRIIDLLEQIADGVLALRARKRPTHRCDTRWPSPPRPTSLPAPHQRLPTPGRLIPPRKARLGSQAFGLALLLKQVGPRVAQADGRGRWGRRRRESDLDVDCAGREKAAPV